MVTRSFARGLLLPLVVAAAMAAGCARCDHAQPPLSSADAAGPAPVPMGPWMPRRPPLRPSTASA